jgi:hypothetical protein
MKRARDAGVDTYRWPFLWMANVLRKVIKALERPVEVGEGRAYDTKVPWRAYEAIVATMGWLDRQSHFGWYYDRDQGKWIRWRSFPK